MGDLNDVEYWNPLLDQDILTDSPPNLYQTIMNDPIPLSIITT